MVRTRSGRIASSPTYEKQQQMINEAIDCADDRKVFSLLLDAPIDIFTSFVYNSDEKSMNAVMRAAAEGLKFILELIITTYPSSMDLKNKLGETALMIAIMHNERDIARLLIDRGANLDVQDNCRQTALMIAIMHNERDIARLLIDRGANLDVQDNCGKTALLTAVSKQKLDIARLLIDGGANLDIQDIHGYTALVMDAAMFGSLEGEDINEWEITKLLIDRGANLNSFENEMSYTAIMYHVLLRRDEIARLLLKKGANLCFVQWLAEEDGNHDLARTVVKELNWLSRRNFLMFLATQSYLPSTPSSLPDTMPRDEVSANYEQYQRPETRSLSSALHSVFSIQELQRYIATFLGTEPYFYDRARNEIVGQYVYSAVRGMMEEIQEGL